MTESTSRPVLARRRALPPAFLLGGIVLMALLDRVIPVAQWAPWPWNLLGLLPTGLGGLLIWRSSAVLASQGTPFEPFQIADSLVTHGPFRWTRNPMYVGAALILTGIAVAFGSVTPLAVVPAYVSGMHVLVVLPEEEMLRQRFGDAYVRYQGKVRRWL